MFKHSFETFISNRFISRRAAHKLICKMDLAYLRHIEEAEKFELTFQYENTELKVKRQFNLSRQINENVSAFTARIATNLQKEIQKKNKKQEIAPVSVKLHVNNNEVDGNTALCKDIFTEHQNNSILLTIHDRRYNIIINSPCITAIALPKTILTNCFVSPTKFEAVYTDKGRSTFQWFKSSDKKSWIPIGNNTFCYETNDIDFGHFLKLVCTPKNETSEGPSIEVVSSCQITASPSKLPFEERHKHTKQKCQQNEFRVVSYNILADAYADSDYTRTVLHPYCPPFALQLDYRRQLYTKELLGYNADIICLQEVDRKVFKHDLVPLLAEFGYLGDFCPKGGSSVEGAACFYNKSRFELIETIRIVISQEFESNPIFSELLKQLKTNSALFERFSKRSSVLQVSVLKVSELDEVLIVANTHLYFHPDADHIRLLQGGIIVKYLESLKQKIALKEANRRVSVVFCGDFNSVPECGIYQLYTTGAVGPNHIDYKSNAEETVEGVSFTHNLQLSSACGTPEYTNFTVGFAACLDYIFYEKNSLQVTQYVTLPERDVLEANTALPSIVFPSDHVSLCADLKFQ